MRDPGLRDQPRTELQIGALLLFAFAVLIAGVAWITGTRPGTFRQTLYGRAPAAASVGEGSRVLLRGVDVGEVTRVELDEDGVRLALEIGYRGPLPRDTHGEIRSSGFLGQQVVELVPGTARRSLAEGDTIRVTPVAGLQELATSLGDRADEVLQRTNRLLADRTLESVQAGTEAMAGSLTELSALLEAEREELRALVEGLAATSGRLAEATEGPELENTLASLDSLTRRLSRAADDLDGSSRSLASILDKVDRGEGSLGRMVNDPALYDRLTAATENLQTATEEIALLTKDVRERPERYLRELKLSVF